MELLRAFFEAWRDELVDWAQGKSPWLRLALLGYLAWAGLHHLADPLYSSWFGGITLIFHEMGHVVFSPFGRTLTILGGTILQLFVPIAAAIHLGFWQRDGFGFGVCTSWLSFSLWNVATYMADALRDELPLVSLGDGEPSHDWGTLLTEWHVLNHADHFAFAVRAAATLTWLGSLALCGWLCWLMWKSTRSEPA
jgi:hypothetical protein